MGKGWITVERKIQEHWLWSKEKPFDIRSAWIDLLLLANHKDNKFPLGIEMVMVQRGCFITSERKLSDRWGWSNTRVRNFLKLLESDGMIIKKTDSKKSTITIVNYCFYQNFESTETAEEQQDNSAEALQEHQKKSAEASQEHTNNNDITMINHDITMNNKKETIGKFQDNEISKMDYQQIADMYNNTCVSFPRVTKLSDARKKAIKARMNNYSLADFQLMFEMAEKSLFLKGGNDRNWTANFDWLIQDKNMVKVLDGNYVTNKAKGNTTNKVQSKQDQYIDNMKGWLNDTAGIC